MSTNNSIDKTAVCHVCLWTKKMLQKSADNDVLTAINETSRLKTILATMKKLSNNKLGKLYLEIESRLTTY